MKFMRIKPVVAMVPRVIRDYLPRLVKQRNPPVNGKVYRVAGHDYDRTIE